MQNKFLAAVGEGKAEALAYSRKANHRWNDKSIAIGAIASAFVGRSNKENSPRLQARALALCCGLAGGLCRRCLITIAAFPKFQNFGKAHLRGALASLSLGLVYWGLVSLKNQSL